MAPSVGVIDYGQGNKGSILNMLKRVGVDASLVSTPETLRRADRLILPGVGAYDSGVRSRRESGLGLAILEEVGQRG